jgi:ABC-type lipoprotein release transport system permease subunit
MAFEGIGRILPPGAPPEFGLDNLAQFIGIRLAPGAPYEKLRSMFVRQGSLLFGAIIGLAVAMGVTRLLKSLLFGVSPLDPVTYTGVLLVLGIAVILSSCVPGRRASLVDPAETLRVE